MTGIIRRYRLRFGETIAYSRCRPRSLCSIHLESAQVSTMKKTLLLIAGVAVLLSGCIVVPDGGGYYGDGYYHHHRHWD
ncbi:hypothetical protein C2U71_17640 [Burkholderia ubonensis]|nr:hypothetical protein C2U71_17640 [Burkholderia ubonensis]